MLSTPIPHFEPPPHASTPLINSHADLGRGLVIDSGIPREWSLGERGTNRALISPLTGKEGSVRDRDSDDDGAVESAGAPESSKLGGESVKTYHESNIGIQPLMCHERKTTHVSAT